MAAPTCAKKKQKNNVVIKSRGHLGSLFHSVTGIMSPTGTAVTLHIHKVGQEIAQFKTSLHC